VFGQVQSRDVVPARARIGGTLVEIGIEEGAAVSAGDAIATVVDDKLALRLDALEARHQAVSARLRNAQSNLERAQKLFERGTVSRTRLEDTQTEVDVLANEMNAVEAEKAVIEQQAQEGTVLAPASGRVLSVPVTEGSVILPGETIARIAGGGYFLRLALPERHAGGIVEGETVIVGARELSPDLPAGASLSGRVAKVYPEISEGRVIADVEVEGLGDFFVGERTLVSIPVGSRQTLAVPAAAIRQRHGIDVVRVRDGDGLSEVAVIPGARLTIEERELVEVLTGLRAGDIVVVP
ncbi:MAG: efflux RND transporter periplasmic adaptor subunit, partial [Rhizobiales bacterium]|nr:efflux RND transporter periplasmic adaptor subunit [Hyphomicrobiales bacterium]